MKKRLIIILGIIVLLPLVVLVAFGVTLARQERERAESRYQQVLRGRLRDINSGVSKLVKARERELLQALDLSTFSLDSIRERVRTQRLLRQIFIVGSDGRLEYPNSSEILTSGEISFLERTASLWDSGESFWVPAETQVQQKGSRSSWNRQRRAKKVTSAPSFGWHTWFWGEGLRLIFWQRLQDGRIVGAEVERTAMIADVIGQLPVAGYSGTPLAEGRIILVDAQNKPLYQWGDYTPPEGSPVTVSLAAPLPFSAWSFNYYLSLNDGGIGFGRSAMFNVISGIMALALSLIAMAIYFYRESARDMHEASQRVSFVNQVSHELKTPLTNIRMYAELLEKIVPDNDLRAQGYINVLVGETRRLSRLITNVLTFAKQRRDKLKLHKRLAVVDDIIDSVVASFTPALDALGIRVELEGSAGNSVNLDVDALEQILGNLINNVEKYAANAATLKILCKQDNSYTTIIVADDGGGIPVAEREKIFAPFVRLSNRLTDGVSGTGIGLSIARQLARLHGGDLRLLSSNGGGARFEVRLLTEAGGLP